MPVLYFSKNQYVFKFLNLEKEFKGSIDWNFQGYGKLWNYNLQYLDFLKQGDIPTYLKITLVSNLYQNLWEGRLILEPYPASLRIMNMIRFLLKLGPDDNTLILKTYLLAEVNYLSKNLEYHILANHLLENAFALLMGGYFFNQKKWIEGAEKLLTSELEEQILKDGAHFELSPMYHQIILFRVLEALAYLPKENKLSQFLRNKAELMLSWLNAFSFRDGSIAHFNDSCDGIALDTLELLKIGNELGIKPKKTHQLKESGYRKFDIHDFELIADVNGISPFYQPGHSHADTFSFCLHYEGNPIIVDPGISTYEISPRRDWERSTKAHNTLVINGINSAEVWAGFRVGKRLKVEIIEENKDFVQAIHDGYRKQKVKVSRKFDITNGIIEIIDFLEFEALFPMANIYFHFHPSIDINQIGESVFQISNVLRIEFIGDSKIELSEYKYCLGYNSYCKAKKIKVTLLGNSLKTTIIKI
ncbi:heparinase II/III domain-containing protein [Shivajiella indica]|uniref:Heparinase II/III family protein n=1 Tax=Shivajiella indica TaxID=872115 RepID=A0ABW5BBL9_9BACT